MNSELEGLTKQLTENYYLLYPDMQRIQFDVIYTNSLNGTHFELRPDLKDRLNTEAFDQEDYNGRMVLPHVVGERIYILLNNKKILEYSKDGSMTWLGTLAHELTHAIDYHQMAIYENLDIYDRLLESNYRMFQLWSEFHARKLGYNYLRKQFGIDNNYDEKQQVEHVLNYELQLHFKRYNTEYHDTNNGNLQMYLTMQLLGRYSVWCDLFPDKFNESFLRETFIDVPWMYKLLIFLRTNNSLEAVYTNFKDMRLLLKENWRGL